MIAHAINTFAKMVHCKGDRCTVIKFNDDITYLQKLKSSRLEDINLNGHGNTRLYDSMCYAVDHLCNEGDKKRCWFIFVIIYSNDNKSTRSADECREHIVKKYVGHNRHIFLISVGKNVDIAKLKSLGIDNHVHAKSFTELENSLLFKVCFGGLVAERTLAMDYVILVDNSAPPLASPAPPSASPASLSPAFLSPVPLSPVPPSPVPHALLSLSTSPASPLTPVTQPVSRAPLPPATQPVLRAPLPKAAQPVLKAENTALVTIKMREFSNAQLHPNDRQIFREFASINYPNIPTVWSEKDILFLVLVESRARSIVGLLVMLPYDDNRVHIRVMVVDKEYRKHGFGTRMLKYVSSKYNDKTVTLNVTFDRLDLLNFYYDKGYVKFEEFSTEHKVIVFSLIHNKL